MFTIEQIEELHERLGNAESLSDYVRSLAVQERWCPIVGTAHDRRDRGSRPGWKLLRG